MGWLIERRIKALFEKHKKHQEMITKAELARAKIENRQPGAVRFTEQVIKLAKKLKYDKAEIREIEEVLRMHKLDTPKSQW